MYTSFTTTLVQDENGSVAVQLPAEQVDELVVGMGHRLKVSVNGYSFRGRATPTTTGFMIALTPEQSAAAEAHAGAVVVVVLELADDRDDLVIPADLLGALYTSGLADEFQALPYAERADHLTHLKAVEAEDRDGRQARIRVIVDALNR